MENKTGQPRPKLLPPIYFALALILMLSLHWLAPGPRWIGSPWGYLGALLIVVGAALPVWGARLFQRHGTTIKPFEKSSALVTEGLFRYSRNPIYVGLVTILTGVALVLGSLVPWVVIPLFVWILTSRFIRSEEEALEQRFGAEYLEYKQRVRRWVGRRENR